MATDASPPGRLLKDGMVGNKGKMGLFLDLFEITPTINRQGDFVVDSNDLPLLQVRRLPAARSCLVVWQLFPFASFDSIQVPRTVSRWGLCCDGSMSKVRAPCVRHLLGGARTDSYHGPWFGLAAFEAIS